MPKTDQAEEKDYKGHGVSCQYQQNWAKTKIPEECLQKTLMLLDQMVAQMYAERS